MIPGDRVKNMKLIILGLDGLGWQVFNNFAKELPNLSRLKESGALADLETVNPPVTAPAWVSFQTAQDVGNHGYTSFEKYDKDFNFSLRTGDQLEGITFYEILERKGYKQLIVNLPYSNPARISGDIVHSWLTYRPDPHQMAEPPSLYDELKTLKDYLTYNSFASEFSSRFFRQVIHYTRTQFDLLKEAISKKDYDALFCLNSATDGLQHAAFPDIVNNLRGTRGRDSMLEVLKIVDDFVGWIYENDFQGHLVLVSDHGFQNYEGTFYINQFLEREGYLSFSSTGTSVDKAHQHKDIFVGRLVALLKSHAHLLKLTRWIYSKFIRSIVRIDYQEVIDLEKTVAYMPSPAEMMIYLRLRKQQTREEVVKLALEIINKINRLGLPIIAKLSDEVFINGKYLDSIAPIVLQSDKVFIRKGLGPDYYYTDEQQSWHSRHGIFLGYGPKFREGFKIDKMHITDVVPTLFAAIGIPLSDTFDGIVRKEALKSYTEQKDSFETSRKNETMTEQEQTEIAKRLKGLGYL
jgi:predicted AlkP superfamily phosphohydrolase/phosphomutase